MFQVSKPVGRDTCTHDSRYLVWEDDSDKLLAKMPQSAVTKTLRCTSDGWIALDISECHIFPGENLDHLCIIHRSTNPFCRWRIYT